MEILTNIFFWLFAGGTLGALLSIRTARRFQEKAAFAEFPEDQDKFEFRSKISYVFFAIFLLAGLSGLGVSGFQFFSARGGVSMPQLFAEGADPTPPSDQAVFQTDDPPDMTPEATATGMAATQALSEVEPTPTPGPTFPPVVPGVRVIGNTNYQGANVRQGPSLNAPIVAKLINGTEVLLLDTASQEADGFTWQRVQLENGTTGWVVGRYLLEEPLEFNP